MRRARLSRTTVAALLVLPGLAGLLGACRAPAPAPEVVAPEPPAARLDGRVLVVDAGHGGQDPGAIAVDGTREKDINRAVADLLVIELERRGARVVESRPGDATVALDDRAARATSTACDLLVSVHADAFEEPRAEGATVFIARGALATSQRVGAAIEARLRAAGIVSRGVKSAGFRVLLGHARPSVLVECGFLTNPGDRGRLLDPAHRARLARAIADGISDALAR